MTSVDARPGLRSGRGESGNDETLLDVITALVQHGVAASTLDEHLEAVPDMLLSLPWMPPGAGVALFVRREDGPEFVLAAQRNVPASVRHRCATIAPGFCLCGEVGESGEAVFTDSRDPRHQGRYPGMAVYAHQCMPIAFQGEVLGVLNLFADPGYRCGERERRFLQAVADALASTIVSRRSRAELRRSNERLHSLLESSSDWAWEVDADGVYTYASPRVRDILGYGPEEILGRTPFDLMPEDEARRLRPWFATMAAQARGFTLLENRALHRDGHEVIPETSGSPYFADDGTLLGYRGIDRDITARKRTEEKLALALAERDNIFNSIPDVIFTLDVDGRLVDWNKRLEPVSGLPADQLLGRHCRELVVPEDAARVDEALEALFRLGEAEVVARIPRADGEELWFHWTAALLRDTDGEVLGITGVGRDVTETRRLEAELAAANQRLEAEVQRRTDELVSQKFALDQHSIVAITDRAGRITYVNDKFCEISQYSREELIGQTHSIVNSGYHPNEFYADLWRTIRSGEVWKGEIRNRRKDGSTYWVDTTIVPFLDESGKPYQYVSIRTDITRRKQYQLDLERARDAALEAARAKSEFLATMSHEIRTPMNSVLGMLELVRDLAPDPELREYVETAERSARALMNLLNDLLDYSRMEADRIVLESVPFSLPALIDEVAALLGVQAQQKGLACETGHELAGEWFHGDPARLRQIATNLMGNAIKFTRQGRISVRSRTIARDGLQEHVRIEVADTGIGIPAERQAAIFDPFVQGDGSTTRHFGGSGLGLSICRQLVECMGGEIGVESEPGRGSLFWIVIPLAPAAPGGEERS